MSSFASSGAQTPGFLAQLMSPKKNGGPGSPTRKLGLFLVFLNIFLIFKEILKLDSNIESK